jgi:hypothetical protein
MPYIQLPSGTQLSNEKFISEMNLALKSLDGFHSGMVIRANLNGYWLEVDGVVDEDNRDLLAAARKIVLGA